MSILLRLDDSRPDVNRSWRRRRFVTTADADGLMSHMGKTVERSDGRTVRQPSMCRDDGLCGRTGCRARGEAT